MKRFSAREFALLTLPILFIGGVGFWATRRPAPKPKAAYVGPKLQFRVEKPTALQAFDGVKTVLAVQASDDSEGVPYRVRYPTRLWLQVASPQGTKAWSSDTSGDADETWISPYHFFQCFSSSEANATRTN